ncbi:MAG: C40 family peptidase [Verrucomicrobia bacterium]|nr:C40 family peptidase [Verrucomicrobiota bacterium]
MKARLPVLAVTAAVAVALRPLPTRAEDDDAWKSLYRSLRGLSHAVQSHFTSEGDDSSDSEHKTRRRHSSRKPRSHHHTEDEDSQDQDNGGPASSRSRSRSAGPGPKPTPTPEASPKPGVTGATGRNGETAPPPPAQVSSLRPEALKEYAAQPANVQELIHQALALTEKNLTYTYGSADPANSGMDCSGFIYYVLQRTGFHDVPRDSSEQYLWVRKDGIFHAVVSRNEDTFELQELRPGDLLFWTGTYSVNRDVPITHVMIYLGKEKETGKRLMVGASDGRSYHGERRCGVSVFDFKLPSGQPAKDDPARTPAFVGYATIPGLRPPGSARERQAEPPAQMASPTPAPTPTPTATAASTPRHKRRAHRD